MFGGVAGIQRDQHAAYAQHGDHRSHHLRRAFEKDADAVTGAHAHARQSRSDATDQRLQVVVGQIARRRTHRNGLGRARGIVIEAVEQSGRVHRYPLALHERRQVLRQWAG